MTNPNKAELRRLCDEIENCGGIARLMKGGLFSSWIELVSPSSVRALLDECDRLQATCGGLDRQNDAIAEEIGKVTAERDAALAELEAIKASGWRNHSVNYARAEKCPQTLETAQAAWDRDQELIEEQRQQIAKDSQSINDLRQKLEACRKDAERYRWLREQHNDQAGKCWVAIHQKAGWVSLDSAMLGADREIDLDLDSAVDAAMSQEVGHD